MPCTLPRTHAMPATLLRRSAALVFSLACAISQAGQVDEPESAAAGLRPPSNRLAPAGLFVQIGVAPEAIADTIGATWNLRSDRLRAGSGVYLEASLSRWHNRGDDASDHGVLTQIGLVPVLRHEFDAGRSPWFVEGGVGATLTSSVYHRGGKRFSTAFNFGDHVGVGLAFGPARRHELALRFEHFSNGGIKEPNPGQNFVQLRYLRLID